MTVDTDRSDASRGEADGLDVEAAPHRTPDEGCPSPLGWSQVLDAFRSQSAAWSISPRGGPLRGRTFGRGRPLYFLNGFAGDLELFSLLAWLLQDEFRCVLFNYPSAGEMPRKARRSSVDALAEDLFAIADAQQDESFSVFATSFGGAVALAALGADAGRIDRAVLHAGFARRELSPLERMLAATGRFLPGTLACVPFREAIHRANHQRSFPPFDQGRWSFFTKNVGRTPIRDLAERASIIRAFDFRGRLPALCRPILLVGTEAQGSVAAGCLEELARGLPHSTVETLHSTGHLVHLTHPHRLAKVVRAFLSPETRPRE